MNDEYAPYITPIAWEWYTFFWTHFFSHFRKISDRKKLLEFRSEVRGACIVLRKLDKLTEDEFQYVVAHVDFIVKLKLRATLQQPFQYDIW